MTAAIKTIEESEWDVVNLDISQYVEGEWYTEDGNKFPFGKDIDISLETDVIGYDEDDEWEEIDETNELYTRNELETEKHI